MELFNIIAGVASIASLGVSLFVASKVIKITNTINVGSNNNDSQKTSQTIKGNSNTQIGNVK